MKTRSQRLLVAILAAVVLLAIGLTIAQRGSSDESLSPIDPDLGSDDLAQMMGQESDVRLDVEGVTEADAAPDVDVVTVRGRVMLPNGEPAAGAVVRAQTSQVDEAFEAVADQGGMFSFGAMPLALYAVEAAMEGYGPAIAIGVVPGGSQLRLVLEGGQEIRGLVISRDAPVPDAVVHLGGPGLFPQRAIQADGAGQFRVSGLRPGHYEYAVTAPGLGSGFTGELNIDDVIEDDAGLLQIEVDRAREMTLRVVDGATGDPVVGGVVTVAATPLHVLSIGRSVEYGVTLIDFLPRGHYWLRVRAPGYLPYEDEFYVGSVDEEVVIELQRGATLSGVVVDEAGNGVPNVGMSAVVETPEGGRWELRRSLFDDFHRLVRPDGTPFWPPTMGFTSRSDGTFEIRGVPAGRGTVLAQREGFAPATGPELDTHENVVIDDIRLVLEQGRTIRGRVEDEGGGSISGASLSVRSTGVPAWFVGDVRTTDGTGTFELGDLAALTELTVRHPDFATVDLDLVIPPEGIDDLIIRLSGEQLPQLSGRVFTTQGAAATGASVWLMHGDGELPVCRATVGPEGWFHASHCSATPERLIASRPDHAPLVVDLAGNTEEQDWRLMPGGEVEVVSQRTPVVVTVEPHITLPAALWQRPHFEMDRWSRQLIRHVAPGDYDVICRAEGLADGVATVRVAEGQRVEALCPFMRRIETARVYVLDPQGAPVSRAFVMVDGGVEPYRGMTGDAGFVEVEVEPGHRLRVEAMHEAWGRGDESQYIPFDDFDPIRVELGESIAGADPEAFLERLEQWGVHAVADRRSIVLDTVEDDSPAGGVGLRRHDTLLWARPVTDFRFSIGVRRGEEVQVFELVREPTHDE